VFASKLKNCMQCDFYKSPHYDRTYSKSLCSVNAPLKNVTKQSRSEVRSMSSRVVKFKDWRILSKIMSITVITMFISLSYLGLYIMPKVEDGLLKEKQTATKNVVDAVYGIIEDYGTRAEAGQLGSYEAMQAAKRDIGKLRYAGKNYFWINDLEPTMVMHPIKPELNGQDLADFKDPDGKRLFVAFVDVAKAQGSGFVDYLWPKPGFDKPVPKVSYVKLYKPWGWIIGSGIYLDDVGR
jgi:methyl-accepting chemotaxis protein